jgi:hypothetical protein
VCNYCLPCQQGSSSNVGLHKIDKELYDTTQLALFPIEYIFNSVLNFMEDVTDKKFNDQFVLVSDDCTSQ